MTIVESIVSRELPAEIIYEDDLIIAFMDIRPINRGHTLICPKFPYPDFVSVPEDVLLSIFRLAKKIYNKLTEKYAPDGIGFLQNNGAFNELNHYHLHIYPCHKDKGGRIRIETIGQRSPKQLSVDAQKLFITPMNLEEKLTDE
jgi:histidine triad (HIT) family protein